jgi:hypothetical protein
MELCINFYFLLFDNMPVIIDYCLVNYAVLLHCCYWLFDSVLLMAGSIKGVPISMLYHAASLLNNVNTYLLYKRLQVLHYQGS